VGVVSLACEAKQMEEEGGALVDALLWETHARLAHFAQTGETTSIDLGGLPMSARDRESLDSFLGRGEVSATVEVVGRSEVWETGFSSVWRVRHFGDGTIAADLIEITSCPSILAAHRRDADNAARHLAEALETKHEHAEIAHEA
jgi:hypothetical protein